MIGPAGDGFLRRLGPSKSRGVAEANKRLKKPPLELLSNDFPLWLLLYHRSGRS